MSWVHHTATNYEYWNHNSLTFVPAIYRFHKSFWDRGGHAWITRDVEWQYTMGDGNWHPMPEELKTLEDKQAYVYTLYRLEGHDGNS